MDHKIIILDSETHALNGYPIEIAYVAVDINAQGVRIDDAHLFDEYFSLDAQTPMQLSAMAVHHILPQDLYGKPHFSTFRLPAETVYIIGHNIHYDVEAIQRCGQDTSTLREICTLALARMIWQNLDSYNLSALSYFISDDWAATRQMLRNAHNAQTDILLTAKLLAHIVKSQNITSVEQLWQLSQLARIPKTMPFGKYRGQPLETVPIDYIQWLLRQDNLEPNLREALENQLS